MFDPPRRGDPTGQQLEESTERWVRGKSHEELLSDLRVYAARLRDDPHSVPDRLRVGAIQLRLGRIEEALIHYEGVLRAYVAQGQIVSAIALCRRILNIYPDMPRLQRILAALYARVPHRQSLAPTPVTPISDDTPALLVHEGDVAPMAHLFEDSPMAATLAPQRTADLLAADDMQPTMHFPPVDEEPIPLTRRKM